MKSILEDVFAALKDIGHTSKSAARVVGLILLGVVLNMAALHITHSRERIAPIADIARTDIKIVQVVVVRALKKIGDAEHGHLTGC